MNTPHQQQIRDRAYALWEAEGRPEGMDKEHWMRAERELSEGSDLDISDEQDEVGLPPAVAGPPVH